MKVKLRKVVGLGAAAGFLAFGSRVGDINTEVHKIFINSYTALLIFGLQK